jgi:hypothetical protein
LELWGFSIYRRSERDNDGRPSSKPPRARPAPTAPRRPPPRGPSRGARRRRPGAMRMDGLRSAGITTRTAHYASLTMGGAGHDVDGLTARTTVPPQPGGPERRQIPLARSQRALEAGGGGSASAPPPPLPLLLIPPPSADRVRPRQRRQLGGDLVELA